MHFISILDDRFQKIGRARRQVNINLRGYNPRSWIPDDLSYLTLPVYAIAYNLCPTSRDIYLEFVEGLRRTPTWNRYRGRMIDELYKILHQKCVEYVSTRRRLRNFDLYNYILDEHDNILNEARTNNRSYLTGLTPLPSDIQSLNEELSKIVKFEAGITAAFLNFQIAKVRSASPRRIFNQFFNFNTSLPLNAPHQGFRADATPDFIYRSNVVGDIKSGKWQEFFYYTITAYALAYEEHTNEDMNYGVILHVETSSRLVPVHYKTRIELIDDSKRERFRMLRNRKLEIVHNSFDPGVAADRENCDPSCSFFSICWGNSS